VKSKECAALHGHDGLPPGLICNDVSALTSGIDANPQIRKRIPGCVRYATSFGRQKIDSVFARLASTTLPPSVGGGRIPAAETIRVPSCDGGRRSSSPVPDLVGRMLALAGIAAIFCRSLSACRRPLHCRLVETEKPTASPQRSPETQIDRRPDGLRRRPPCCFSVASWSLRTRRHGVVSDFEWTFVHFCSCLPSMQIMTRPLARFAPSA